MGSDVRKAYLGEDSDALRARLLQARALAQSEAERQQARMRLVRLLRAEGLLGIAGGAGSLLAALAAAGAFRNGLAIIGTAAFRFYEGELGVRLPAALAQMDRLALALPAEPSPALLEALADFTFDPVPALRKARAWRWRQSRGETEVGFFMPARDGDVAPRYLKQLGVYAEAMPGLDRLTADAVAAAVPYRGGVLVSIPKPELFATHALAAYTHAGQTEPEIMQSRSQAETLLAALKPGAALKLRGERPA